MTTGALQERLIEVRDRLRASSRTDSGADVLAEAVNTLAEHDAALTALRELVEAVERSQFNKPIHPRGLSLNEKDALARARELLSKEEE